MPTILGVSTAAVFAGVGAAASAGGFLMNAFGGSGPSAPNIPTPKVPAPPAPAARFDAGANVVLGTQNDPTRVSGNVRRPAANSTGDVLGGLGRSGLNI